MRSKCPECNSYATKVVSISNGTIRCQICSHVWTILEEIRKKNQYDEKEEQKMNESTTDPRPPKTEEEKILGDPKGKHYAFDYQGVRIDPYRILDLYQITHPAHQHALKKLLRAGKSRKLLLEDVDEVILTLNRWKLMIDEDSKETKDDCPNGAYNRDKDDYCPHGAYNRKVCRVCKSS